MFDFNLGIDLEAMQRQNDELKKLNARVTPICEAYCSGDPVEMSEARKQLQQLNMELGIAKYATMAEFDRDFFSESAIIL